MDTQQMSELLLTRLDADQAKADARHEEARSNQTKAETSHKELLATLEADRQANMKAWREETAAMRNKRMNANHKEMVDELEPKNDERDSWSPAYSGNSNCDTTCGNNCKVCECRSKAQ
jgi:thioesterase domain-containing protein